jgi:hypothetical protein
VQVKRNIFVAIVNMKARSKSIPEKKISIVGGSIFLQKTKESRVPIGSIRQFE